jgi:two-component system response regulator RegA
MIEAIEADQPLSLDDYVDKSMLIVDDDKPFLQRLGRAMTTRGYDVRTVDTVGAAIADIASNPPAFAIIDMRLEDGSGLDVIRSLSDRRPEARSVMLTGYGNIATAVAAVKNGAFDYLSKPADADQVHAVLMASPLSGKVDAPDSPMSAERVRWEHIMRVYEMCDRNVSHAAEKLNMHRRTLQRILSKRAPR